MLGLYRLITYILLPVAVFFGLIALLTLFAAFVNPPVLIVGFLLACFVIYVFASFRFLNRAIVANLPCKASLRDWIRVNAFVCIAFSVWMLAQTAVIFFDPSLLVKAAQLQIAQMPSLPEGLTEEIYIKMVKAFLYFFFFLSVALLVHVTLTFKYLKQYKEAFNKDIVA